MLQMGFPTQDHNAAPDANAASTRQPLLPDLRSDAAQTSLPAAWHCNGAVPDPQASALTDASPSHAAAAHLLQQPQAAPGWWDQQGSGFPQIVTGSGRPLELPVNAGNAAKIAAMFADEESSPSGSLDSADPVAEMPDLLGKRAAADASGVLQTSNKLQHSQQCRKAFNSPECREGRSRTYRTLDLQSQF